MRWALLLLCVACPLTAQTAQSMRPGESLSVRLEGRVPPAAIPAIDSLVEAAVAESLPAELLVQKAIEGGAKHVEAKYIVGAVRINLDQLRRARNTLVEAGDASPTTPEEVAALNAALKRGLTPSVVSRIVAALPAEPRGPAFHAVADLVERGFDQDSATNLILAAADHGLRNERLLDVSSRAVLELQSGKSYSDALNSVASELPDVPGPPEEPSQRATRPPQRVPAPQGAPSPPRVPSRRP
ncbi:MAG TPA: hypothetical protein VLV16_03575 [Gemmatimonadales bacterium]|nr:hypothetical protein [Gemmatimonadales bacterium]